MRNYLCSVKFLLVLGKRKAAILRLIWIWLAIDEKLSYRFEIESYIMIPLGCEYERQGLNPIGIIFLVNGNLDGYFLFPNQLNHININTKMLIGRINVIRLDFKRRI